MSNVSALGMAYEALFRPSEALGKPVPLRATLLGPLALSAVLTFLVSPLQPGYIPAVFCLVLAWILAIWLTLSAGIFLVARLVYKVGEFESLAAAVALSFLPFVLLGPIQFLHRLGMPGIFAAAVCAVVVIMWSQRVLNSALQGATGLRGAQVFWLLLMAGLGVIAVPMSWLILVQVSTIVAIASHL